MIRLALAFALATLLYGAGVVAAPTPASAAPCAEVGEGTTGCAEIPDDTGGGNDVGESGETISEPPDSETDNGEGGT